MRCSVANFVESADEASDKIDNVRTSSFQDGSKTIDNVKALIGKNSDGALATYGARRDLLSVAGEAGRDRSKSVQTVIDDHTQIQSEKGGQPGRRPKELLRSDSKETHILFSLSASDSRPVVFSR